MPADKGCDNISRDMAEKHTYKVIFHNQGKIYEVYARAVHQSGLYGFVEVEKLLFGQRASVVLDPSEEHLKNEFEGVARTYLPIHSIIRIDEVEREGHGKITQLSGAAANVTPFPIYTQGDSKK
ncbi:MAG: DUF1820 family protein [Chromatiales bacterium]